MSMEIMPRTIRGGAVRVPGSKSYTHRMLIAAALSDGACTLVNPLASQDTELTAGALRCFGIDIQGSDPLTVRGSGGRLDAPDKPVFLGNSGTSMRFVTALAALARGRTVITGTPRLQQRPVGDLLQGLTQLGATARSPAQNGCPPVEISGGPVQGGAVDLRCAVSSQFLSALLLIGPCLPKGLTINVQEGPVSRPYIDLTVDVMQRFGIDIARRGYAQFQVAGRQAYRCGRHVVEPDCSQAGYFWAAAAVTGTPVTVAGISRQSKQGDIRLLSLFEKMGCRSIESPQGLTLAGRAARAVTADMADIPDVVPTLAVVAAFARGDTVIRNVGHLKAKESDRLAVVAGALEKMGVRVRQTGDGLVVCGGNPCGAVIDPHDDHRIAMSFAIAGLVVPGVVIQNERCVEKSFPDFWRVFNML